MSASQQPHLARASEIREHKSAAESADPAADLNTKQWKFAKQYAILGNATQAAINAGYSQKSAAAQAGVLLQHPRVREMIDRELALSAERCAVTQDSVLRGLVRESTYTGVGSSHAARVRALELIGKTMAMFTDQSQVIGSDGKPIDRFAPVILTIVRNGA